MAGFDFETNPFWVLRVSPRDGGEALAAAVEDAFSDGRVAEKDALSAQRALMAAKPRLDAEVAWFPGVAPSNASRIVASLAHGTTAGDPSADLPAVVRANVLAHRAGRRDVGALQGLVDARFHIDPDAVLTAVNADRAIAGFPRVDRALLEHALAGLRSAHVSAAVDAIMASPDPPGTAAGICKTFVPAADARGDFAEEVVERYDAAAASRVAGVEQTVHAAVRTYGQTGNQADLEHVRAAMKAWRSETEARRLVFSAKKLDEPRSAELFQTVRELGKELVNQRDVPERAQALFGALRAAFVDVPSVADQMDRDVAEIAGIVMQKRFDAVAGELVAALAEARKDLEKAAFAIRRNGFRKGAGGLAGRLYAGFEQAAVGLAGTEHASLPWTAVRQLAVEITNTAQVPATSRDLVEALSRYAGAPVPIDVAELLVQDRRALDRIDLTSKLTGAMKAGRTGEALRVISALEPITDDKEELASLRQVRARVEADRRSKRNWAIGFSVAVAVLVGLAALNDQGTTTRSTSSPPPARQTTYTPPIAPPDDATAVVMPPVSKQRALSRQELRWCLFQLERLKGAQALLPDQAAAYEAAAFNAAADDWRSRCAENLYDQRDKAIVDENVASNGRLFTAQGAEIVRGWRQRQTSAAPAAAPPGAPGLLDLRSRDDVGAVQRELRDLGFYKGMPDGAWGPGSRSALIRFKQANGLPANDVWDAATQAKLFGSVAR
jgi:hypothetical protein